MRASLLTVLVALPLLTSCNFFWPVPDDRNIDINGTYAGRLIGSDNRTALLDVTIQEKDQRVSVTVKSQETGATFTLSGTRSVYDASPVTVNVNADLGTGSVCAGGLTDRYKVNVIFYAAKRDSGTGYVTHEVCNATTRNFENTNFNAGTLEITRK